MTSGCTIASPMCHDNWVMQGVSTKIAKDRPQQSRAIIGGEALTGPCDCRLAYEGSYVYYGSPV